MHTKTKEPELIEVTEDMVVTLAPPAKINLPVTVPEKTQTGVQPLEQLTQLGKKISEIHPIEPSPKTTPAPKIHQRPKQGFD